LQQGFKDLQLRKEGGVGRRRGVGSSCSIGQSRKKSNNKLAAAMLTTTLTFARGVGGASPNLASLFQDNKQ
jgi:hypothetical protein